MIAMTWIVSAWMSATPPVALVLWQGHLEDALGPVDRTVSLVALVSDAATGEPVGRIEDSAFLMTLGDFFLDVPVFLAESAGEPERSAVVDLVVDGTILPPFEVRGAWPVAHAAAIGRRTSTVASADALAGILDPLTLAALLDPTESGARVAFANVSDVPTEFIDDDGDGGLDVVPGDEFTFVDGRLGLRAGSVTTTVRGVTGVQVVPESVDGAKVASSSLQGSDLVAGSVPLSALANQTVRATHLGSPATRVPVFRVVNTLCDGPLDTLQFTSACPSQAGNVPNQHVGFLVFR
jgi:hypothetical protein